MLKDQFLTCCLPIYHTYTFTFVATKGLHFVHRDADKCFVTGEHGVKYNGIYLYIQYMLTVVMYSQADVINS